jgi:hypothetical protein
MKPCVSRWKKMRAWNMDERGASRGWYHALLVLAVVAGLVGLVLAQQCGG